MNIGHYLENMLGERERILLVTRQHWFVLMRSILLESVAVIVILVASLALSSVTAGISLLGLILLIVPLVALVRDFLFYQNRQFIVTNRRVIQISGIFNKNVTDSSLEKVNDVKMVQSFWGRLFNFGHVEILTASELGANKFRYIGNPVHFKTAMLNAKEQLPLDESVAMAAMTTAKSDVPAMITQLDQLRQKGIVSEEEFQRKKQELLSKM